MAVINVSAVIQNHLGVNLRREANRFGAGHGKERSESDPCVIGELPLSRLAVFNWILT